MGLNRFMQRCAACALALSLAAPVGGTALAQQPDPKARAQELFQQGLAAVDAGDCARAISLFQRSRAAYPARGTLLNLADCEAKVGKVASAWGHFNELMGALDPGDHERIAVTQKKIAALKSRVPWLVINVADGAPAPSAVLLDETPLPSNKLGVGVPVDPGEHVVSATWENGAPEETRVSLAEGARQAIRLVPRASQAQQSPPAGDPAAPAPDATPSNRRTLGFVAGGIGLAGLGVSAVTGILAMGAQSDLEEECPNKSACSQQGLDLASKGETLTTTSTVAFVVGVAGLGAGLALFLTAPSAPTTAALTPAIYPGGGGAGLHGRF